MPSEAALLLTADAVDAVSTWNEATWTHTARRAIRTRSLRVHILGFSVLNGCFSHDLGYQPSPKLQCDAAWAWSRRMTDALTSTLARESATLGGVRVHTSTFAKNAVDPSFFAHCLSEMLPADTDVLLLEAGSNMHDFANGETGLPLAIPAIRAHAPHATLVLVTSVPPLYMRTWTSRFVYTSRMQTWFKSPAGGGTSHYGHLLRRLIARDAASLHCDVIDMPTLLRQQLTNVSALMAAGCTAPGLRHAIGSSGSGSSAYLPTLGQWYAMNGTNHHPTRAGHHLMGEIAARHVLRRLTHAITAAGGGAGTSFSDDSVAGSSDDVTSDEADEGGGDAAVRLPRTEHEISPTAATSTTAMAAQREVCFNSAEAMPVHHYGGSWQLVDDGEKTKGVSKLGWASTRTDDPPLLLGPLPVLRAAGYGSNGSNGRSASSSTPPFPVCNTVRLGYLFSTRAGQGDLRIHCAGACSCYAVGSSHGQWQATYPFPVVKTDAGADHGADPAAGYQQPPDRNLSVTAMTEFTLVHSRPPDSPSANASAAALCMLEVYHLRPQLSAHERSGVATGTPTTRVRVDTLSQRHEEAHGMMQVLRMHQVQCH